MEFRLTDQRYQDSVRKESNILYVARVIAAIPIFSAFLLIFMNIPFLWLMIEYAVRYAEAETEYQKKLMREFIQRYGEEYFLKMITNSPLVLRVYSKEGRFAYSRKRQFG